MHRYITLYILLLVKLCRIFEVQHLHLVVFIYEHYYIFKMNKTNTYSCFIYNWFVVILFYILSTGVKPNKRIPLYNTCLAAAYKVRRAVANSSV